MKRRKVAYSIMFIVSLLMMGCGNGSGVMKLVAERDSLKQINDSQSVKLDNYEQTIVVLNATLDSIAAQEDMIFFGNGEMPVTKEDVKHNLERFEALLKQQEQKISQLEAKLAVSNDSIQKSLGLITHLKKQISIKNIQISQLKEELEKKNVDLAQLKEQVESQRLKIESQSVTIDKLSKQNRTQGEALARQDAILNNGYVLIGSKADLKRKGITSRGNLVANAALDRSKFYKVDIRTWREVSFQAKRPRILTDMPASSYELTTSGDRNFTLYVKTPADFWRISNYLVIQTD